MNSTNYNPNDVQYRRYEVCETQNPIQISLNGTGRLLGVELEEFYYAPSTTPTASQALISIKLNDIRGIYNSQNNQISSLRTVGYQSGLYSFQDLENDRAFIDIPPQESVLNFNFVYKKTDSSTTINEVPVVFNNNYLLKLVLLVAKH